MCERTSEPASMDVSRTDWADPWSHPTWTLAGILTLQQQSHPIKDSQGAQWVVLLGCGAGRQPERA